MWEGVGLGEDTFVDIPLVSVEPTMTTLRGLVAGGLDDADGDADDEGEGYGDDSVLRTKPTRPWEEDLG